MLEHPDYVNAASRSKHRDALNAEIDSHTVKRTSAEWIELLNEAGVPVRADLFHRPDVRRSAGPAPRHGAGGEAQGQVAMKLVGQPVTLSRTPSKLVVRPPAIGEHTDAVLKEFGFKPKDIAALRKANAI